jgi:hypothetical protein
MSGKDMVRELDAKGFKNAATIIVYKTAFMPISLLISIYSHYNNTIEVLKADTPHSYLWKILLLDDNSLYL